MSNCLIFALRMWWRHGGYIVIRKSRNGWWPHFIWCKDLRDAEIQHYVPHSKDNTYRYVSKILFPGYIKTNDVPEEGQD